MPVRLIGGQVRLRTDDGRLLVIIGTEEILRTLIEAELAPRETSNARTRMRNAAFPVVNTLDELDRTACSIPGPTPDYLASLEWITAKENLPGCGTRRRC